MTERFLTDLFLPIAKELDRFRIEFNRSLSSDVELINKIGDYIQSVGGKHIRPALVLLSARLCGTPTESSIIAASLVEILHTATLIHDDIVDDSETRRGQPSIKELWKNKIAVLTGDFLFSRALSNMLRLHDFTALELLSHTSELLSSGELLQLEKSLNDGMDEEVYYKMIWAKTASLFATSCKVGALTVSAPEVQAAALFEYGRCLGLAFQIKDDLFDCTGTAANTGKPVARDIKANLITLPLIHAFQKLPGNEAQRIHRLLRNSPSSRQIKTILTVISENGGISYAEKKCAELTDQAVAALDIFQDSEVKTALLGLARYNLLRTK